MRLAKILILILCSFMAAPGSMAQDTKRQDSVVISDTSAEDEDEFFGNETSITQYPRPPALLDSISHRAVNDSISATLKKQKTFEYANDPEYWVREKAASRNYNISFWQKLARFFAKPAVKGFMLLLFVALAIYLIIKVILVNQLYIFKSSPKKKKVEASTEEAALMGEDLDALISQAMLQKEKRPAIRFLYLKTLKLLDRKGWITFHPQATNQFYRQQVNNYAKGKEFGFLSTAYEHVWYGNFQLTEQQFETIVHNFNHFQNTLKV
jgi:uncharacterized protein DUF4129